MGTDFVVRCWLVFWGAVARVEEGGLGGGYVVELCLYSFSRFWRVDWG